MSKFKKGDIVIRTTEPYNSIKVGYTYIVQEVIPGSQNGGEGTLVVNGEINCSPIKFELSKNHIVTQILNDL